jgi:hypothetical protein
LEYADTFGLPYELFQDIFIDELLDIVEELDEQFN